MRELYAVELRGDETSNAEIRPLVESWADRHVFSSSSEDIVSPGSAEVQHATASDGSHVLILEQGGDAGSDIRWRSEVALGPPDAAMQVTVRIRVAASSGVLAPLDYDFRAPAIVRTILRKAPVMDAGERILPDPVELGASSMDDMVGWLRSDQRCLPVVVVSRVTTSGILLVDAVQLARQLAGIAHVRVLSSAQASWALTTIIGQPLSVWDGAVRVYFPGFGDSEESRQHRVWFPDRVGEGLIGNLRSWFGTLSSSRTPEHPVHERLRADRRERIRQGAADGEELTALWEEVSGLEARLAERDRDLVDHQARHAELERRHESDIEALDAMRRSFAEIAAAPSGAPTVSPTDGE